MADVQRSDNTPLSRMNKSEAAHMLAIICDKNGMTGNAL